MSGVRIALANIRAPTTREESVALVQRAIAEAAERLADIVCFPECYVPGYRWPGNAMPAPDAAFLEHAWSAIASSAAAAN
ncbi:MAG: carbon-nitrogen hydrolase family protein, partial [Gemmatimonadaceae bacterium]|nr:carbon-nitrogen hydrolase family protein [Gemmatimonadaceae bacterium]